MVKLDLFGSALQMETRLYSGTSDKGNSEITSIHTKDICPQCIILPLN